MSRSEVQSDLLVPGSSALAEWTTLHLADATSYDPGAMATGGWSEANDVISGTFTSASRDGFNEGARLHWPLPSAMQTNGTMALEILVDQIVHPQGNGKFTLSAGVIAIPTEATAVGAIPGIHTNGAGWGPTWLSTIGIGGTSGYTNGSAYTSMRVLWAPDVTGATEYHGAHYAKYRRSSGQSHNYWCDYAAARGNSRIVLHVGCNTLPTAGIVGVLAGRVRVRPVTLWSAGDAAL